MTFRIVAAGNGQRPPLVVMYLVGAHLDPILRTVLPGCRIVASAEAHEELLPATLGAHGTGGPVVLVGYSMGCQDVRQALIVHRDDLAGVVCIDGTHASVPPVQWQLDVWRQLGAEAARGERLFVATCTQMSYVERLPVGTPGRATSTRHVLELALNCALPPGAEVHEGGLHVLSYPSADIDREAHVRQQTEVLPDVLRRFVAPWLLHDATLKSVVPPRPLRRGTQGDDVADWQRRLVELDYDPGGTDGNFGPLTEAATLTFQRKAGIAADGVVGPATRAAAAATRSAETPALGTQALGAALLSAARGELVLGVKEDPSGSNDGLRIREYFAGSGTAPPANWCAAFVRFCLSTAARAVGAVPPVIGSLAAKGWQVQFERANRWRGATYLRATPALLRSGMVVVWHRGPPGAWTGHIGVVSRVDARRFWSIEGNSGKRGDRVAEMPHSLDEELLLGAGWVDG